MLAVSLAVLRRPDLWVVAAATAWRLRRRGWLRRPPFLPVPDRAYLRLRSVTAYGDADRRPEPADVVDWLEWCRAERRALRPGRYTVRG